MEGDFGMTLCPQKYYSDFSELRYPLVVKPVDSNGSKGVKKVENQDELDIYLQEAFKYSISGDVIVEEFNKGEEVSIDIYVEGTQVKLLSVVSLNKIKQNKKSLLLYKVVTLHLLTVVWMKLS